MEYHAEFILNVVIKVKYFIETAFYFFKFYGYSIQICSSHLVNHFNSAFSINSYFADIEQQAEEMFFRLVKDPAEKENVTEELKATDMMLWVQKMNSIRNRAT